MLDKGIVIAGDIQINLLDIELLTIKLRLLIASVDRAREMGINWWESDPSLQSLDPGDGKGNGTRQLERENQELRERLERLERRLGRSAETAGGSTELDARRWAAEHAPDLLARAEAEAVAGLRDTLVDAPAAPAAAPREREAAAGPRRPAPPERDALWAYGVAPPTPRSGRLAGVDPARGRAVAAASSPRWSAACRWPSSAPSRCGQPQ